MPPEPHEDDILLRDAGHLLEHGHDVVVHEELLFIVDRGVFTENQIVEAAYSRVPGPDRDLLKGAFSWARDRSQFPS